MDVEGTVNDLLSRVATLEGRAGTLETTSGILETRTQDLLLKHDTVVEDANKLAVRVTAVEDENKTSIDEQTKQVVTNDNLTSRIVAIESKPTSAGPTNQEWEDYKKKLDNAGIR